MNWVIIGLGNYVPRKCQASTWTYAGPMLSIGRLGTNLNKLFYQNTFGNIDRAIFYLFRLQCIQTHISYSRYSGNKHEGTNTIGWFDYEACQHKALTKWLIFCRRYIEVYFLKWIHFNFKYNFIEICFLVFNWARPQIFTCLIKCGHKIVFRFWNNDFYTSFSSGNCLNEI